MLPQRTEPVGRALGQPRKISGALLMFRVVGSKLDTGAVGNVVAAMFASVSMSVEVGVGRGQRKEVGA